MSERDKELAEQIRQQIIEHFVETDGIVSGNFLTTLKIRKTANGWAIDIPAQIYDKGLWEKKQIVVFTGKGSYANILDNSKKHKNYVNDSILNGVETWSSKNKYEVKVRW